MTELKKYTGEFRCSCQWCSEYPLEEYFESMEGLSFCKQCALDQIERNPTKERLAIEQSIMDVLEQHSNITTGTPIRKGWIETFDRFVEENKKKMEERSK